ncbi:hypothetical protein bcgnr5378_62090 [Bacillus cereus]|uniref:Site-specific recombinase XerD n=1 Tax=Bacillus cereus TaxID=1396 RepID=A0A164QQS2_BACCE|nr:site-specific integrase [Bacillus cereus]KZD72047.1 Site-specific recombinase XerD [Bacillus cereus]HDR8321556.1 site-specific integrase [Bacillus cereus]HDR8333043.1 site-specific integrase [Bacillus cereus]
MKVDEFRNRLEFQRKHSKTVMGYVNQVENFLAFINDLDIEVTTVKQDHIKNYLMKCKEAKSDRTVLHIFSVLKNYFKFLRQEGDMVHNPTELIELGMKVTERPSVSENAYLEIFNKWNDDDKYNRQKILLHLIYKYQCSIESLVGVRTERYKAQQGILYTKRAIDLSAGTISLLSGYLEGQEREWLFETKHGKPLTASGASYLLKQALDESGFGQWNPIDFYKKRV